MNIYTSLLLGLIQGFGEMLPISSSGHLVLAPYIFGFTDPGLSFDVALHVGTLVAILGYFWREWLDMARSLLKLARERKVTSQSQKLAGLLLVASVPGALFGYFLSDLAESTFRSPLLVAFMLATMGALLWYVDHREKGLRKIGNIGFADAVIIGFAQAAALIPGVSRSGATITASLVRGITREDAAKFSFLMSAPIIAGAALVKVPHMDPTLLFSELLWVGMAAAAISSAIAIKILLMLIRKHSFDIFVYYRFVLAAVVVTIYLMRG